MRSLMSFAAGVLFTAAGAFAQNIHTPTAGTPASAGTIVAPLGQGGGPEVSTIIYDNSQTGGTLAGLASTNFNTTWGDNLVMTAGTGTLDEFRLSVFNASTAGNYLNTATLNVTMRRTSDNSIIGAFSGNVNFGAGVAGLNGGFFSTITFTGLAALATPVVFDTNQILVQQQLGAITQTGVLTNLGVVSRNPPTVGSSPTTFYKDDPSAPPAGLYSLQSGAAANVVYQVGTFIPEPASLALAGLGALGLAARRRRA